MAEATEHRTDRRRQSRRGPGVVAFVLAVVAGLALGAAAGAIAANQTGGETRTAGTAAPPEIPAGFPAYALQYLPGATVSTVESWVTGDGYEYECEILTEGDFAGRGSPGGAEHWMACRAPRGFGAAHAEVQVEYDGESEVLAVHATCERGANTPEDYCPTLFGETTSTVLSGEGDVRDEAAAWAVDHADDDAVTALGDVQLKTDLGRSRLTLISAGG